MVLKVEILKAAPITTYTSKLKYKEILTRVGA